MGVKSYKDAGVDIEKGEQFARFIGQIQSKSVSKTIGDFAGGIELDMLKLKNPVLLATTDGVGTKLLVAKEFKQYHTIGIDLVAMNVNDLLVCGAKPLLFLDYIACGKIDEEILKPVVKGIITGCEIAGCTLAGGETAEMPDMYGKEDFDLAGFCVGLVEKDKMLPQKKKMDKKDIILGLPSSGIHSNGLSLARKILTGTDERKKLLEPTKIYSKELNILLNTGYVSGAAHITGGGLYHNIRRIIPDNLEPRIYFNWEIPNIFQNIQQKGGLEFQEMEKVFNLGIGIALIIKPQNLNEFLDISNKNNIAILKIGELI
jgi:phosphoribosylformylglycinamidine cyclo-ligase